MNIKNFGFVELSNQEAQSINGGTWLSYALGYICGVVHETNGSQEQAAVMQALQDFH